MSNQSRLAATVALSWAASVAVLLAFVAGCGEARPAQPKERYFRGNAVVVRLDHRRGTVIGKQHVSMACCGLPHDVWMYTVRFPATTPGACEAYSNSDLYEFELDPAPAEEKR